VSVSKVEICNFALQAIGDESILSLSDQTVPAQQCNLRYDSSRRAVLEMGLWNFAIKRVSLPLEASTPEFDFSHQFTLPSDLLRVIGTDRELGVNFGTDPLFNGYKTIGFGDAYTGKDRYKIEDGKLLYDDDVCKIAYITDVEDTTKFSPLFVESLSLFLASRIAYKITGSRTMERELLDEFYNIMKKEAQLSDSQQGTTERNTQSKFISVRF
jgi:hypothetical protein